MSKVGETRVEISLALYYNIVRIQCLTVIGLEGERIDYSPKDNVYKIHQLEKWRNYK